MSDIVIASLVLAELTLNIGRYSVTLSAFKSHHEWVKIEWIVKGALLVKDSFMSTMALINVC